MSKRFILNFAVFVVALCALIWHYFLFIANNNYPSAALSVSFIFAGFTGLISYILIKAIWLKVDKNFAEENEAILKQSALSYFEKHKLSDGAYFETSLQKETILGRVYFYFLLVLAFFVGLITQFEKLGMRIATLTGIIAAVLIVVSAVIYFLEFLKKEAYLKKELTEDKIRVYRDHFKLINTGRNIFFKDINSIEIHSYYGVSHLIINNQSESLRFSISSIQNSSRQQDVPRLFEALGFKKINYKVESRFWMIIPAEWIDKYIYTLVKSRNIE